MSRILGAIAAVFLIIMIVPFLVYVPISLLTGLEPTGTDDPGLFMLGVAVSKLGTAIGFTLVYQIAWAAVGRRWFLYALPWWVMFVSTELGEAIGTHYTWPEAMAGIVAEVVYTPLAAYAVYRILRKGTNEWKPSPSRC